VRWGAWGASHLHPHQTQAVLNASYECENGNHEQRRKLFTATDFTVPIFAAQEAKRARVFCERSRRARTLPRTRLNPAAAGPTTRFRAMLGARSTRWNMDGRRRSAVVCESVAEGQGQEISRRRVVRVRRGC
jgi:hypothetical protein